jgi:hypothetical protein
LRLQPLQQRTAPATGIETASAQFPDRYYERRAAPGKPAAYQIAYIDALRRELHDVTKQFDQLLAQDLPALNDALKSKGQQLIEAPAATISVLITTRGSMLRLTNCLWPVLSGQLWDMTPISPDEKGPRASIPRC